jgi:hypothetical protein
VLFGIVGLSTVGLVATVYVMGGTWLAGQGRYLAEFESIELVPAPPAWIAGGKARILESVARASGRDEPIRVLEADLEAIARDLALHSPWIAGVDRVERSFPNRLRAIVSYRRPVAWVEPASGIRIAIDSAAVALPAGELDEKATGALPRVEGLGPIEDYRPGLAISSGGAERAKVADRARAGASLAAFLQARQDSEPPRSWSVRVVNARYGARQLFFQTSQNLWVLWGHGPAQSDTSTDEDLERWRSLSNWIDRSEETIQEDLPSRYLELGPDGPRLRTARDGAG